MNKTKAISALLLLIAAAAWGFAFVAQKVGSDYIGPFGYNAARYTLGAAAVFTVSKIIDRKKQASGTALDCTWLVDGKPNRLLVVSGCLCGLCLFAGTSLQQAGIAFTSVGHSSFGTALYMVIVPLLSIFLHKKVSLNAWVGVVLAVLGFYFLCIQPGDFSINFGDILTLAGTLFWALQILVIDHYVDKVDGVKLAVSQFVFTALISTISTALFETFSPAMIVQAIIPILYGGLMSVALGFTLQIVAQKNLEANLASLLMSMESVFAVVGGVLILGDVLSSREKLGCVLIMAGVLLAQFTFKKLTKQS